MKTVRFLGVCTHGDVMDIDIYALPRMHEHANPFTLIKCSPFYVSFSVSFFCVFSVILSLSVFVCLPVRV